LETAHETIVIYTVAEAAAVLRVKESWLQRQAAARKIPFTMLGGAYRFTAEHLAAIVRINEKSPAGETEPSGRTRRTPRARERAGGLPTVAPLRPRPRPTSRHQAA
jgi:excisionase family DNA binding protein